MVELRLANGDLMRLLDDGGWELLKVSETEKEHQKTSEDVGRVLDHLRQNRTTESEARNLRDAADRSLTDHATAKSLGR